ncbi:MAG: hypothetical protein GF388_01980 [Candidatus Aegiribacteria sp.]|nr:hypothetical protein [Candidatus Aegiribacteria sp.]
MNFSTFVVSDENRLAYETARTMALIRWTWDVISPLYIYGGNGLGKTHLLSSISRSYKGSSVYIDTADLAIQLQFSTEEVIRRKLKDWILGHDVLLLDDINLASEDEGLQTMIHSILSCALMKGMGVAVVGNSHPADMAGIAPSLLSRISSGTITRLGMPDLEGRIELLQRIFGKEGIALDPEITRLIADSANLSVRQLTSAGKSLISEVLSLGGPLSLQRASELLDSLGITSGKVVHSISNEQYDSRLLGDSIGESNSANDNMVDKFRKMVGDAGNIQEMCHALTLAVEDRIEHLIEQGADPAYISMLVSAVKCLNSGDLYKAMSIFSGAEILGSNEDLTLDYEYALGEDGEVI